ncbi:MAG: hypothetical protein IT584_03505 [Chlamydiae bacterium]|nr:hypothetical protein [Chlamydiota bacterium]
MFTSFVPSSFSFLESAADALLVHMQERVIKTASSYLQKRAQQILYVGAGLSFLAVLTALVAKVVFSGFCMIGAVFCFRLTLWAFQEREKVQAEELRSAKENLVRQILCSHENEQEKEKLERINSELKGKNLSLETCNRQLSEKIFLLEEQNIKSQKDCNELANVQKEMSAEIQKLQDHIFRLTLPNKK